MGDDLPKQYHKVRGREIIAYTIDIFQKSDQIDEIIVSAMACYHELIHRMVDKYGFTKLKKIAQAGPNRQDSVNNALKEIPANFSGLVLVHDAARPLLYNKTLSEAINLAIISDGVLVCTQARDTLVKGENDKIHSYLDRQGVYYAQTPQIFKYSVLKDSMEKAYKDGFYGTDESMLAIRAGYNVQLIEGSILNFKITTKPDLETFQKLYPIIFK